MPLLLATANPHKVEEPRAIFTSAMPGLTVRSLADLRTTRGGALTLREPDESGSTFEANATIKALAYAAQIADSELDPATLRGPAAAALPAEPLLILADDSGIEIDALALADGAPRPGVISSHYSTDGLETGLSRAQRDAANNARVLRELAHLPPERRTARFVCVMALVGFVPSPAKSSARAGLPSPALDSPAPSPRLLHLTRGTFEGRIGIPPRVPAGAHGFGYDPLFLVAPEFAHTGAELEPHVKNQLSHRAGAATRMAEWLRASV